MAQPLSRGILHLFFPLLLLKTQFKFNSDDAFVGPLAGPFHHLTAPHRAISTGQTTRLPDMILSSGFGPDYALVCDVPSAVCHTPAHVPKKAHFQT